MATCSQLAQDEFGTRVPLAGAALILSLRISASTFESASDQSRNHCWNCCCREGHPPELTHLSHAKAMQAQALHLREIRRPVRPASRVRLLLRHKIWRRIGIISRKKQPKSSVVQTWQRLSVNRRHQQGNQARQALLGMSVTPKSLPCCCRCICKVAVHKGTALHAMLHLCISAAAQLVWLL